LIRTWSGTPSGSSNPSRHWCASITPRKRTSTNTRLGRS
jgi:hypothetical protein